MSREEESEFDQLAQADNSMGELSEDLLIERGGFGAEVKGVPFQSGKEIPPDIAYQTEVEQIAEQATTQSVPQSTRVTTVYDARPINARDWTEAGTILMSTDFTASTPAELEFIVPKGYVAIMRGFRWMYTDTFPFGVGAVPPNNYTVDAGIFVDDTVQPDYDEIAELGVFLNTLYPCYILAAELQKITLRITPRADAAFSSANVYMEMYGNLLLSKGLPLQYQPGSL